MEVRDEDLDFDDEEDDEQTFTAKQAQNNAGDAHTATEREETHAQGKMETQPGAKERAYDADLDDESPSLDSYNERLRQIVEQMTPEQQQRYEYFVRSTLNPTTFRKVMEALSGIPRDSKAGEIEDVALAARGASKLFVGDLIETAVDVQQRCGTDSGPLKPWHVREAFRQLQRTGRYPPMGKPQNIFSP